MNWELTSTIIGIIVAIFGVATYIVDKIHARRNHTIEKVGELLKEYREKNFDEKEIKNERFMEYISFLSKIEQFCIAVDSRVYSKRTIKKYGSKFLCSIHKKYKDSVIAKRRYQFGDTSYIYLDKLVKEFERQKGDERIE